MHRRPPDEDQDHRNHQHDHHDRRRNHRAGETEIADRGHHQRYAGDAAKARAVQRQADRHAALPVEPQAQRVGDHAEAGAGPAKGEQGIGKVELPGLAHLTDRDRGHGHRAYARDHAVPGTECLDRLADEGDQRRAGQIEERRAGRDQRRRPAVQPMQLGDIDALAVEAEPPAESRQQEADDDDAPAVVADRGFVDGGKIGGVQRCFFFWSCYIVMPGLVPASTSSRHGAKDVDGRVKPGHDGEIADHANSIRRAELSADVSYAGFDGS